MSFRQSPQKHSKSTQAMAIAARNVAETAVSNAFKKKRLVSKTFGKLETVETSRFHMGGNATWKR